MLILKKEDGKNTNWIVTGRNSIYAVKNTLDELYDRNKLLYITWPIWNCQKVSSRLKRALFWDSRPIPFSSFTQGIRSTLSFLFTTCTFYRLLPSQTENF